MKLYWAATALAALLYGVWVLLLALRSDAGVVGVGAVVFALSTYAVFELGVQILAGKIPVAAAQIRYLLLFSVATVLQFSVVYGSIAVLITDFDAFREFGSQSPWYDILLGSLSTAVGGWGTVGVGATTPQTNWLRAFMILNTYEVLIIREMIFFYIATVIMITFVRRILILVRLMIDQKTQLSDHQVEALLRTGERMADEKILLF